MTPRIHRLIARIERERRIFENRYLREAHRIARQVRMDTFAALRLGLDVLATVRATIVGDRNHRGIVPALSGAMLTAYLLGLRRTVLEISDSVSGRPPESEFKSATAWLIAWLGLDAFAVRQLSTRFQGAAMNAANEFADGVVNAMARAGAGNEIPPYLPGMAVGAGGESRGRGSALTDLRRQLDARGISADPAHDYALAGLVTTQILRGYGQGQWTGYRQTTAANVAKRPTVDPITGTQTGGIATEAAPPQEPTAFRHISILDERTTEICNAADGTTLAADHPYWQTHWPPLHFNCRSVAVPIFGAFEETDVPSVEPMAGFGSPW